VTAKIIDGVALSRQIREDLGRRAQALAAQGRRPGLAVILVGDDPASAVYVRNKVKACETHGLHSVFEKYDAGLTEADLLDRIRALNADPRIHGILVQMPLPRMSTPVLSMSFMRTASSRPLTFTRTWTAFPPSPPAS
jgi:methylenetetrahydrofolate dehydrogenase (NADP+)/methenyltetrahydrofolate cyclohydrolase